MCVRVCGCVGVSVCALACVSVCVKAAQPQTHKPEKDDTFGLVEEVDFDFSDEEGENGERRVCPLPVCVCVRACVCVCVFLCVFVCVFVCVRTSLCVGEESGRVVEKSERCGCAPVPCVFLISVYLSAFAWVWACLCASLFGRVTRMFDPHTHVLAHTRAHTYRDGGQEDGEGEEGDITQISEFQPPGDDTRHTFGLGLSSSSSSSSSSESEGRFPWANLLCLPFSRFV